VNQTTLDAPVTRPGTLAEAREAVADAGHGRALLFRGGGTKLDWGGPPERVELVVDTRGLDRLVAHNPGDLTATVQTGMALSRLQDRLAAAGQWLAVDPPGVVDEVTIGGVVAAGDAGPRRLRYGPVRDLVIGMTVVLADGIVARSGGTVIKNVAGYDLAKLFCGSLGTLGLVAEIVVRLHPLPESSRTLRLPAAPPTAGALTLDVLASAVVPSALDWAEDALWVRLEGRRAGVAEQGDAVRRLAGAYGVDADVLDGEQEREAWRRLTASHAGAPGETVARATSLPGQLPDVARGLADAAAEAGVEATLASHAGLGLHSARLRGGDGAGHAAAVTAWRRRVVGLGGTVVVRRRLAGVDAIIDPWGEGVPASTVALMRRVKEQFDPGRRCAPGRQIGGI
jgi:glycolate oxidase FAD binding subunit